MASLYDELDAKIAADPSLMKRSGPRVDLSMLLFNHRDAISELWHAAAEASAEQPGAGRSARLEAAVDALRPIFGER